VPSAAIITDAFTSQAQYQADVLSFEPPANFVPHPVSNMDATVLATHASSSFEAAKSTLEKGPQGVPTWAAEAAQGCST